MLYSSPKSDHLANGGRYGIQEVGKEISFADLPVRKSLDHNHCLKMMERLLLKIRPRRVRTVCPPSMVHPIPDFFIRAPIRFSQTVSIHYPTQVLLL